MAIIKVNVKEMVQGFVEARGGKLISRQALAIIDYLQAENDALESTLDLIESKIKSSAGKIADLE